ncbi:MAG: HAMP domain-containing sensor histidine kinase [Deinococcota bacterium]
MAMLNRVFKRLRKGPRTLSIRTQVALVVAALSMLPNLVVVLFLLLPIVRDATEMPTRAILPLVTWGVALLAISVSVGYFLSKQLLSPLSKASQQITAMQRVTSRLAQAQLYVREDEPREVRELKLAFNNLLKQVHREQSRRSAFLATLMHDLKTPLVAGNHLLGVIRDNDNLPREERITLIAQLLRENQKLIELLQKMVEAHKYEREGVPLRKVPFNLEEVAELVIDRVAPLAEKRNIHMEVRGHAKANIDPRELERALYNLVSNAVRYAESRIRIEVFAGLIRLSDDGPGLPAPLEKLAEPFNAQPITIAGQQYTAGTGGLGLFIARRIIETHGGRLTTEATSSAGTIMLIYLG